MAKDSFGQVKRITEAQKLQSNPGGLRQANQLFKHIVVGSGRKHMARYAAKGDELVCSVCGATV